MRRAISVAGSSPFAVRVGVVFVSVGCVVATGDGAIDAVILYSATS